MEETVPVASPWFIFLLSIKRADNIYQYNKYIQQGNKNTCIYKIQIINISIAAVFCYFHFMYMIFAFLSHLRSWRNMLTKSIADLKCMILMSHC